MNNSDKILKEELKPFIRQFKNGMTQILILWIISQEKIHGYGIMKKLDEFYAYPIEKKYTTNASPSKIYPILNNFENKGLIKGNWDEKTKKKSYEITKKGKEQLDIIRKANKKISENENWKAFRKDLRCDI